MLQFVKHLSTRSKIILLSMVVSTTALFVASIVFFIDEIYLLQKYQQRQHEVLADIVAAQAAPALAFNDAQTAKEILEALRWNHVIASASLINNDGQVIATFKHPDMSPEPQEIRENHDPFSLLVAYRRISRPIQVDGQMQGEFTLVLKHPTARTELPHLLPRLFTIFILVSLFALALSSWLQRFIAKPISQLTKLAKDVSDTQDFSLRLSEDVGGDVGALIRSFNEMLNQIQLRDDKLSLHQESLEDQVRARTTELEYAKEKAEQAASVKASFLANVSHELRTPLNAVIGMTDLLMRDTLPAEQKEQLTIVHHAGSHLLTLINDLLDFSKIEAGKFELNSEAFNLEEMFHKIIEIGQHEAQKKGLVFEHRFDRVLEKHIIGDATRIEQVLLNLVSNAVKFTETGTVSCEARCIMKNAFEERVRFCVRDTGIGIPEDKINLIFKSFQQIDTSMTRKHGGTGLGLVISRRLVELMGGALQVRTTPGMGSLFWFEIVLPLGAATQANVEATAEREKVEIASSVNGAIEILVVEDNKVNQAVLEKMLQHFGYKADVVSNGSEAVSAMHQKRYNLVLMDCQMPVMDGYEATKRIRDAERDGQHTPIVALTAHAMKGDREKCIAAGMDDHISKPVQMETLRHTILKHTQ